MIEALATMKLAVTLKTIFACLYLVGMFLYLLVKADARFYLNGGWELTFLIVFLGAIFGGLAYFVVMYG